MTKTAKQRTEEIIAEGGRWHGDNVNTAKAKWFLNRVEKRKKKNKLEKASRKRNRK